LSDDSRSLLVGRTLKLTGFAASVVHLRSSRGEQILVVLVGDRSGGRAIVGCVANPGPEIFENLASVSLGVGVDASGTLVEATGSARRFPPYALRACSLTKQS